MKRARASNPQLWEFAVISAFAGGRIGTTIRWLALAGTLGVVLLGILLPSDTLRWMRRQWVWFNYPLTLIDGAHSAVNLVHAILFLLLGMAMRVALPRWRLGRVVGALLLLGVATELVQFLVPGRDPRVGDVVVDVVAAVIGWAAARGLGR